MIGIIDYGMGNLLSVKNALDYLGEDCKLCNMPDNLQDVDKIILPGVGAFPDCVKNLKRSGLFEALNHYVIEKRIPILGICLGMQVMAKVGLEMGVNNGFGWFDADVIPMGSLNKSQKIPNIGWENIEFHPGSILLKDFYSNPDFYFVHSYYMSCNNESDLDSWYWLGDQKITASVRKDHIFGTQFHPEKSSDFGRQVLINFIDY
jgi:imidazole glycerol-phosphate synthase subunit HisH